MGTISAMENAKRSKPALLDNIGTRQPMLVRHVTLLARPALDLPAIVLLVTLIILLLWNWILQNWNIFIMGNVSKLVLWDILLITAMIRNVRNMSVILLVRLVQANLISVTLVWTNILICMRIIAMQIVLQELPHQRINMD